MKHRQASGIGEFIVVDEHQQGYSRTEVDAYFTALADDFELLRKGIPDSRVQSSTDIRKQSFDAEQGGYSPSDVDHALDRVEDRFAEFERRLFIEKHGRIEWEHAVEETAELVMGRLNRAEGHRFRRPSHKLTKGYFVKDVDALCNRLCDHFRSAEELSPTVIRNAVFASATGDMCYEETQVDAFLDKCISLMLDLR